MRVIAVAFSRAAKIAASFIKFASDAAHAAPQLSASALLCDVKPAKPVKPVKPAKPVESVEPVK
jgi:hypothetical protein